MSDAGGDDWREQYVAPYLALVTHQHQRPKYLQTVAASITGQLETGALLARAPDLYDIDTARGEQLDTLGHWIGMSRFIDILIENIYFSWDNDTLGWDVGLWWQPWEPSTAIARLDDEHYRLVLKARIISNNWDGTVPGAYEAWQTLFGHEGYQILIQNGMAAAIHHLTWDGAEGDGWDRSSWPEFVARANFLRNSALAGAHWGFPGTIPTHWVVNTGLSVGIASLYDQYAGGFIIDLGNFVLSGTTIGSRSTIYFEEVSPDHLMAGAGQDWTLSVYYQQLVADPAITQTDLVIEARRQNGVVDEFVATIEEAPGALLRRSLSITTVAGTISLRVGLRLTHPPDTGVAAHSILLGQPQLEIGVAEPTDPIRTTGSALVAHHLAFPGIRLNGGMHMIYGLLAPYQTPPPPPAYFHFDGFTSELTAGPFNNVRAYGIPVLTDRPAPRPRLSASFAGSGAMIADVRKPSSLAASLAGEGLIRQAVSLTADDSLTELTADGSTPLTIGGAIYIIKAGPKLMTAAFAGSGVMATNVAEAGNTGASLSGEGLLQHARRLLADDGVTELTVNGEPLTTGGDIYILPAPRTLMAGSGSLSASADVHNPITASMAGAGDLQESLPLMTDEGGSELTADDTMTPLTYGVGIYVIPAPRTPLAGAGSLSAELTQTHALMASLSGEGDFAYLRPLTADDGTTELTADDTTTPLTPI